MVKILSNGDVVADNDPRINTTSHRGNAAPQRNNTVSFMVILDQLLRNT